MSDKAGGSAFPNITPDMNIVGDAGVTLRDYFAAKAPDVPTWWITSIEPNRSADGHDLANEYKHAFQNDPLYKKLTAPARLRFEARWRYAYADAMIKERNK